MEDAVSRDEIIDGLAAFLKHFRPGISNQWDLKIENGNLDDFCKHLKSIELEIETTF